MSNKCTPLRREAHLEVKSAKTPGVRTTFGRCDVEKVHAVVARSTFGSQKCSEIQVFEPLLRCQLTNLTKLHSFNSQLTTNN